MWQENGIEEMRVQENATASCAKMTEERSMNGDVPCGSKRGFGHGNVDGAQSPNLTATGDPDRSCSIAGGRLKFFKGIISFVHKYNQGKWEKLRILSRYVTTKARVVELFRDGANTKF